MLAVKIRARSCLLRISFICASLHNLIFYLGLLVATSPILSASTDRVLRTFGYACKRRTRKIISDIRVEARHRSWLLGGTRQNDEQKQATPKGATNQITHQVIVFYESLNLELFGCLDCTTRVSDCFLSITYSKCFLPTCVKYYSLPSVD